MVRKKKRVKDGEDFLDWLLAIGIICRAILPVRLLRF
jgi:hypothetical protein